MTGRIVLFEKNRQTLPSFRQQQDSPHQIPLCHELEQTQKHSTLNTNVFISLVYPLHLPKGFRELLPGSGVRIMDAATGEVALLGSGNALYERRGDGEHP